MTEFCLRVLSGVLSALLTAVPVAAMTARVARRIPSRGTLPESMMSTCVVASGTASSAPVITTTVIRERRSPASTDSESGTAVLIAAVTLVAAWFFVQHPIAVNASLLGLAAGCVSGLGVVWWSSLVASGAAPPRAAVPTLLVAVVTVELTVTVVLFHTVRMHGANIWQMGALLHTGADSTPFIQNLLAQYGELTNTYGLGSVVMLMYAVAVAVGCVLGVLSAAITVFDWACSAVASTSASPGGSFVRRRAHRFQRLGWAARFAPTLVPAVLIGMFLILPTFLDQPEKGLHPTAATGPRTP